MIKWEPGWEGCESPFDYGWKVGTEHLHEDYLTASAALKREGVWFSDPNDFAEFCEGYDDARSGW